MGIAIASPATAGWSAVCALDDIIPDTGVSAIVAGRRIAVVRLRDDRVFAVDDFDPFSKAFVIARGIVGSAGGTPKIASPMYKQAFDLVSGACLDKADVRLRTYPARVVGDLIEVQAIPA